MYYFPSWTSPSKTPNLDQYYAFLLKLEWLNCDGENHIIMQTPLLQFNLSNVLINPVIDFQLSTLTFS